MKTIFSLILAIFLSVFLAGCAEISSNQQPNLGYIATSAPVFLSEKPTQKIAFISINDTSGTGTNFDQILSANLSDALRQNGFYITNDENKATYIIKGNLNYFARFILREADPFARPFFGRDIFRRGFYRRGIWDDWDDEYELQSYVYKAQISLLIRTQNSVKKGKKTSVQTHDYTTNLNWQSDKNLYSKYEMSQILSAKITEQIINFLSN